jgi:uncharacterized membrane protein
MEMITNQAKYIFALPFLVFGAMHLMMADNMAGLVPAYVPGGVIWVYLTGVALVAASLAIMVGKMAKLASFLLGVLMLVFAFTIHLAAVVGGDQMAMGSFLKDMALAGAAFFYSGKAEA